MPLGKSGQYYMNPHEMKRKGDMPGAPKEPAGDPAMDAEENAGEQAEGDGLRHHQIDETPEGGAHSVKTNADGTTEEMDHPTYEDACAAAAGDDNDGEEEGGEEPASAPPPDMGDMNDMAGSYAKAAEGRK